MSSSRYIPKLEMVAAAAKQLPAPETWRSDTYQAPLNNERLIEFRKVKFKGRAGETLTKWVYDGKVRVD